MSLRDKLISETRQEHEARERHEAHERSQSVGSAGPQPAVERVRV